MPDHVPASALGAPSGHARDRVAAEVRRRIGRGEWSVGDRLPSESVLAAHFGVARMTVHAALAELARQGLLTRKPGAGTRVCAPRPESTLFEVRNVRDEIRARGGQHTTRVIALRARPATHAVAHDLDLPHGATVYHSVLVHCEDGRPLQIEDRHVNPAFAPHYLDADYTQGTPYEHLMGLATLDEVEQAIEAGLADATTCRRLELAPGSAVLTVRRRTWSGGVAATTVRLVHPAERYRLVGRFKPGSTR